MSEPIPPSLGSGGASTAPSSRARRRSGIIVLAGAIVAAVVLVAVFLFGGIPGISSKSSGGSDYPVTFVESGLPTGTSWSVVLQGSTEGSTGDSIGFSEPNGVYLYRIANVSGFASTPSVGHVTVNGSGVRVPIVFSTLKPLGTAFAWGTPINATGVPEVGCPSTTGHYCYAIEVVVSAEVSTSQVLLSLRNDVGTTVPWPSGITVSLLSPTSASAVATYNTTMENWTLAPAFSGSISAGFSIVLYTGGTGAANGLLGLELVATGVNGYTGTVSSNLFA